MILRSLALWGTLVACGSTPPAEDLSRLSDDEIAQRTLAFMEEMVRAGTPHLADCDALAAAIHPVVERNLPLLDVAKRYRSDPAKKQWFDQNYGERAKGVGMWLQVEVGPRCGEHAGVQAVLASMR